MSELQPGRELDALVAEKVMGLVGCKKHPNSYCHARPLSPDRGGETRPYSTSIEAAWEILDKFHHWSIEKDENGLEHECALFEKNLADGCFYNYFARGDSAPHAICLAALRAAGYDPNK